MTESAKFTIDINKRMELQSLESSTKSPTFKGLFTITGTNFGTVIEDVTVSLKG